MEGIFVHGKDPDGKPIISAVCVPCGNELSAEQRRDAMRVVPDETPKRTSACPTALEHVRDAPKWRCCTCPHCAWECSCPEL